jgi:hypothetical protein
VQAHTPDEPFSGVSAMAKKKAKKKGKKKAAKKARKG